MKTATVRVHQLAKELNLSSRDLVKLCRELQITAKTATSSLSATEVDQLRQQFQPNESEVPNVPLDGSDGSSGLDGSNGSDRSSGLDGTEETGRSRSAIPKVLYSPQYFFNRELSWLRFNERVLHEAFDPRNPLLERLKFMAIFSSNLDEYFMVRIAGLKQQVDAQVTQRTPDGMTPQEQLDAIHEELRPLVSRQHRYFCNELKPQLTKVGICLMDYRELSEQQVESLQTYFLEQIFPVLTPLAVDPGHPFPYISSLSLNLAVVVRDRETGESHFARVKVPDRLPR
ncbi:MAG TPA: translation initiation factor IF-2 N-terminal domain-containing protein, partial [Stenomitos sp.]